MTRRIDVHTHAEARLNIPSGEMEPFVDEKDRKTLRVEYERRDPGLDPQLIWRGKGLEPGPLTVAAPPIWLQEQVHPKALIEDLRAGRKQADDLFSHFGVAEGDEEAAVEFYAHPMRWSNRMILGDSLQVMASLAEREGLRGKVQMIYIDPPYGIRFNSNFQWSTTSRDVKDGDLSHLTREPEQVRAFRDTWRDGIHSYLAYLRHRLVVARELLTESGSCFVQIGDENVHRVRALMDEVFGEENYISTIAFWKTSSLGRSYIDQTFDFIHWYSKSQDYCKFRRLLQTKEMGGIGASQYNFEMDFPGVYGAHGGQPRNIQNVFAHGDMRSQSASSTTIFPVQIDGDFIEGPGKGGWKTNVRGIKNLLRAGRLMTIGRSLRYIRFFRDNPTFPMTSTWTDTGTSGFGDEKNYVVQTLPEVIKRCLLMTTDPGDLVLDPTCGSGTTAHVAEQWGRRWITVDTSRVALALARARIMGAKYPYYLLADSPDGRTKEGEITRTPPRDTPTRGDLRQGFVYARVPHVTLKSIANNPEIDAIWERMQPAVEAARARLNETLRDHAEPFEVTTGGRAGETIRFDGPAEDVVMPSGETAPANGFMEWEIPRQPGTPWPADQLKLLETARKTTAKGEPTKAAREALAQLNHLRGLSLTHATLPERGVTPWPAPAEAALEAFWLARIARQQEIDKSIAARADYELLYDKPFEDPKRVRVAGL